VSSFVSVAVPKESPEQVRPMIALDEMSGFSLFMLKAVRSGRGNEIVDLAKINLFR
jgi:hypothetical protein